MAHGLRGRLDVALLAQPLRSSAQLVAATSAPGTALYTSATGGQRGDRPICAVRAFSLAPSCHSFVIVRGMVSARVSEAERGRRRTAGLDVREAADRRSEDADGVDGQAHVAAGRQDRPARAVRSEGDVVHCARRPTSRPPSDGQALRSFVESVVQSFCATSAICLQ